jgi:hypothetical protein
LFCESAAELDYGKRRMEADTKAERAFCTSDSPVIFLEMDGLGP